MTESFSADRMANDQKLEALVSTFVGPNAQYYITQFAKIGEAARFRATFNFMAFIFGPIWYGARNLWNWVLPFALLEVIALVSVFRGLFSDLAFEEKARAANIASILEERRGQLAAALNEGGDNVDSLQRATDSLAEALAASQAEIGNLAGHATSFAVWGGGLLLLVKLAEGVLANWLLEKQFNKWRSEPSLPTGIHAGSIAMVTGLVALIYSATLARVTLSNPAGLLAEFPTDKKYNLAISASIKDWFGRMTDRWEAVFDLITLGIRTLLDALESFFVGTPWVVILAIIVLLSWRAAGTRVAIFACAALLYIGFLGFWEKAMATIALLGTAACISIFFGLPIGIICARKPKIYLFIRPVLDFMQTMPSFVYLIPVIAFFGTGKPAGIIATLIFGSPPVIRMTVLGLRGVPETVREAAIAFGASPAYLLFRVDLPLAAPSIMAGINQTIMLSLSMVVIASLIGAKGLGQDVLEALQYASEGQGILAGFAILFCAMILDRIVQGRAK